MWERVERQLRAKEVDYCKIISSSADEACIILQNMVSDKTAARRLSRVIVIGGDGTVHGILPAIIATGLPIGIIPAGSGNDFARGLSIPFKAEDALRIALEAPSKACDYIEAFGELSVTVVGVGLDAEVAYAVNTSRWKKWFNALRLGYVIYIYSLLHTLLVYRPIALKLSVDGSAYEFQKVWLMAVANMPYFGGGMNISPHSQPNDGEVEVCVVHGLNRFGFLRAFPSVYKGTHVTHPNVTFMRGKHIEATAARALRAHGDGESIGETPITVTVRTEKLSIIGHL